MLGTLFNEHKYVSEKEYLLDEIAGSDPLCVTLRAELEQLCWEKDFDTLTCLLYCHNDKFEYNIAELSLYSVDDLRQMYHLMTGMRWQAWQCPYQKRQRPATPRRKKLFSKEMKRKVLLSKQAQLAGGSTKEQWSFLEWNVRAELKCKLDCIFDKVSDVDVS